MRLGKPETLLHRIQGLGFGYNAQAEEFTTSISERKADCMDNGHNQETPKSLNPFP